MVGADDEALRTETLSCGGIFNCREVLIPVWEVGRDVEVEELLAAIDKAREVRSAKLRVTSASLKFAVALSRFMMIQLLLL